MRATSTTRRGTGSLPSRGKLFTSISTVSRKSGRAILPRRENILQWGKFACLDNEETQLPCVRPGQAHGARAHCAASRRPGATADSAVAPIIRSVAESLPFSAHSWRVRFCWQANAAPTLFGTDTNSASGRMSGVTALSSLRELQYSFQPFKRPTLRKADTCCWPSSFVVSMLAPPTGPSS